MKAETGEYYHQALAALIEQVLRCREGSLRVPDLADSASMSRFHLGRLFQEVTGESLGRFLRRVRMERAAFLLQTTDRTVLEIAVDSGYRTGESLSRAFREAFGMLPSEFRRRKDQTWQLPGPTDLHWNAHWGIDDPGSIPGALSASVTHRPAQLAAVWRAVGNYKYLSESWKRFDEALGAHIPRDGKAKFITIYYDSIWTHPVSDTMRADIGWIVGPSDPIPPKMRRIVIPGGLYAVSDRYVARTERNDGWSYMSAIWLPRRKARQELLSFDEYRAWPLPFEQVETRMVVGLAAGR